jgi:hypothetical protein
LEGWAGLAGIEKVRVPVLGSDLVGGVGSGILDAAGLAGGGGEDDVNGVDEEGGCGHGEDQAMTQLADRPDDAVGHGTVAGN